MMAHDIHAHMQSIGTWVDWSDTPDGFKAGNPEREVRRVAVAWQSTEAALREAHTRGADLFITHEPTFYAHMDDDPGVFAHEHARRKRAFLAETGLVVYRCHDVWDLLPGLGIRDSWAAGLGLQGPLKVDGYYALYPSPLPTLGELARLVAARVAALGQQVVLTLGEPGRPISRVAVGTGAACQPAPMLALGADVAIVADDGFSYWQGGSWAQDAGLPLVVVNHATAEDWGVANMAAYITRQFPGLAVWHQPQGCAYRAWTAGGEVTRLP